MQLTSDDVLGGLGQLALWLAVLGLFIGLSIWRAHRVGSTSTWALAVTRNLSIVFAFLGVIGVVFAGFNLLGRPVVLLSDEMYNRIQGQQDVLLKSACPDDFGSPAPLCGSEVGPIPFGPRLVVFLGQMLLMIAWVTISWAIYKATRRAADRVPFHPSVSRTFTITAIIALLSIVVGDLVQQIGMTLVARSLPWMPEVPQIEFSLRVEFWPFLVTVGLFALAAIFRYGRELQLEKERLQHETDGLV